MFVGMHTPQYILRDRPSYGLQDVDGYSNATHIICKFTRKLSPLTETSGSSRDGADRDKIVDLKQVHYMYPIYSDSDLMTPQGKTEIVFLYRKYLFHFYKECVFLLKIFQLLIIIQLIFNIVFLLNHIQMLVQF